MWLEEADRTRVVCVTGTKGKSTVATVLGHLADGLGTPSVSSPATSACRRSRRASTSMTVSSSSRRRASRRPTSRTRPGVVAVTALGEDHVDWHGTCALPRRQALAHLAAPERGAPSWPTRPALRSNSSLLGGDVQLGRALRTRCSPTRSGSVRPPRRSRTPRSLPRHCVAAGVDGSDDLRRASSRQQPATSLCREGSARSQGATVASASSTTRSRPIPCRPSPPSRQSATVRLALLRRWLRPRRRLRRARRRDRPPVGDDDARGHAAGQRTGIGVLSCARDKHGRGRRRRRSVASAGSRARRGSGAEASCCSRRRHRASRSSGTGSSAPTPSPKAVADGAIL
jgi:hypothetical protein